MKTTTSLSKYATILAFAGVIALGAGFATGCSSTRTQESTGEYIDDSTITAKVKAILIKDDYVKAYQVSVETRKGVVQLSGFVDTADQKARAASDAATVKGVVSVQNDLIVK
ncbi:MAG: BON domain-containing protein [Verrucomicrobia bacterium]|nr:BON domain-containing protein [Verrucomicrobiota bacterium]